jgi:hypothetical protein
MATIDSDPAICEGSRERYTDTPSGPACPVCCRTPADLGVNCPRRVKGQWAYTPYHNVDGRALTTREEAADASHRLGRQRIRAKIDAQWAAMTPEERTERAASIANVVTKINAETEARRKREAEYAERAKRSDYCPVRYDQPWTATEPPMCPVCHRPPAELVADHGHPVGIPGPARDRATKHSIRWNGHIPRHLKTEARMAEAEELRQADAIRRRAERAIAEGEIRMTLTYDLDEEHPESPEQVRDSIHEALRAAGYMNVSVNIIDY